MSWKERAVFHSGKHCLPSASQAGDIKDPEVLWCPIFHVNLSACVLGGIKETGNGGNPSMRSSEVVWFFKTLFLKRTSTTLLNDQNWLEDFLVAALSKRRTWSLVSSPNLGSSVFVWEEPGDLGQESSVLAPQQNCESSWSRCKSPLLGPLPPEILIHWGWVGAPRVTQMCSQGETPPIPRELMTFGKSLHFLGLQFPLSKISLGLEGSTSGCRSATPREKYRFASPACSNSLSESLGPGARHSFYKLNVQLSSVKYNHMVQPISRAFALAKLKLYP